MVVTGHRGGFQPENTLLAFKQAKFHRLQAVELDIWVTKDNQLAVIHGGSEGQMPPKIGEEGNDLPFIFNMTLDEAREHFSKTKNYQESLRILESEELSHFGAGIRDINIPTLDEVFETLDGEVLINIEVKTPKDLAVRPLYDTDRLSAVLHEKLQDGFGLSQLEKGAVNFSFISSFDHAFIEKYQAWEAKNKTPEDSKAHFIYLYSRRPEDLMPEKKVTDAWSKGTNCQPSCATPENIQRFHENNQIVGVWIDKAVHTNEGPELWMELISLGVDMFCTDHPLEVIECRDSMLPQN